ncbi:CBL-interacting protein kinase 5-like isoform X5 [Trifolium pratense]|uniref:CBL-interacting protein kinase 5-like isoform X5 n=1 Tax=Trifolium pratense TaxID=57577 RepID=UPI001E693EAB|nr:CBL-interacting protein kinase 5-like isoform X5 [Trifolium pratense]
MEKYEVGRMIGQGNFAKVYHARNLKTGQNVAIKVCNKEMIMRVGMKEQMKREISVMHLVRHPNIVEFYDVMASKTKIYFAMEYVKGGELFNKVSRGKLREDMARKYFQQLIEAVNHCHKRGVYHRDLKLENLLLDENGDLKVSDFGLSALLESKKKDGLLHTTCGTPAYVAPEVIRQKGYDGAMADIWSCGIILYVLLAGYLPFNDKNLMEMYKKIAKAEFKFPQWFRSDAKRLIYRILDPDPRTRITINNIMQNSWFQKGPMSVKDHEDYAMKPYCFNAFDIISLTSGFDLSGLFEKDMSERQHARFATKKPPSIVVSKLEEIAQLDGRFKVKKQNGIVRLEGNETGINEQLSIDTEIFEVSSSVYIVEVNKIVGDMLEYRNFWNQLLKPSLNEIVWVWQEYE